MRTRDYLIILVGSALFAYFLSIVFPTAKKQQPIAIISPLADVLPALNEEILSNQTAGNLEEIVKNSLQGARGTYGIYIKNLRTGETYTQNADRKFEAASLYKLWVAATVYKQISEGILEENQTLSKSIPELNRIFDIDEEYAEQTEGTITRTVNEALDQMITISHNYSALLLSQKVGVSKTSAFLKELGLTNSKMGSPPQTTPEDIAKFYELLYEGKIVTADYSQKLMEVLAKQQLNDRIPKYLPKGTKVAHKTGELGFVKHDTGIIFAKDPILFVALSESNSQQGAAEREAILARDIFNYFEGK